MLEREKRMKEDMDELMDDENMTGNILNEKSSNSINLSKDYSSQRSSTKKNSK